MLRRAVVGLIKGLLLGAVLAALFVHGLGETAFPGAIVAYAMAALTGTLTGLVAGKPIWARGAAVEVGLKAAFGALLGMGVLLVIRRALSVPVDLGPAGGGAVGELPVVSLPLIGSVLAALFELDNTGEAGARPDGPSKRRMASRRARSPALQHPDALDGIEEADLERERSLRRGR